MKVLHLNFLPRSADLGLLLLRLWFGGSMLWLHGLDKLRHFSTYAKAFPDPYGLGANPTLGLVVFAELICAALVVLGLYTRVAAAVLVFNLATAFWIGHGHKLTGQGNGELPFVFLGAFLALFLAGAGRFSVDARIGVGT
jgi:putative oxidoreductase